MASKVNLFYGLFYLKKPFENDSEILFIVKKHKRNQFIITLAKGRNKSTLIAAESKKK